MDAEKSAKQWMETPEEETMELAGPLEQDMALEENKAGTPDSWDGENSFTQNQTWNQWEENNAISSLSQTNLEQVTYLEQGQPELRMERVSESSQTLEQSLLLQKTSQSQQLTMENFWQRVQESSQSSQQTTETTIAPNISITFGDVREMADVNQVAKHLRKILQEEMAICAEGVY
jgi:hypothetical protein